MALLRTPLFDTCAALQPRTTPFAGWDMAVQFSGIKAEHQAVRQRAGCFDISHMGKFELTGPDVIGQLQRLVPSDLSRLVPGRAQYTVLLNPQGGIIDDLIVYLVQAEAPQQVVLIVNAATTAKDRDWLHQHLDPAAAQLTDHSPERVLISVQGPQAVALLQTTTSLDLAAIPKFGHSSGALLDGHGFFARTGYTGEDGFEVMADPATGIALWQSLIEAGVTPCGLGARDTLRLEAAMALYGQDIDDSTTPLEAGLGWLVHLDKPEAFVGRAVLEAQKQDGLPRKLVALEMVERHIARHDYPVLHEGNPVGQVTSGTLSPTLNRPIALAYVPPALAKVGQELAVEVRQTPRPARVVKRPFYRAGA